MHTLIDDMGSFPLPDNIGRESFREAYVLAREAIINGRNIKRDEFLLHSFYQVILDSFRKKLTTGLDTVNYPQHYDMHKQFTDLIRNVMDKGTYIVDKKDAIIPEIHVIDEEAKKFYEETGSRVSLRVCVTGPMELYLKEIGVTLYEDVLLMFAETVKRFAKNSILNSKYVKTEVVSLDEPSFGIRDISAGSDTVSRVLERAFDFGGVMKHIHLHTPLRVSEVLDVKNLNMITFECAASSKNIESVSKDVLEKADKQVRVGISRTDIDSIVAELYHNGVRKPTDEQLVESEEVIKRRFVTAKKKFGEIMSFAGPDCGLGGWPSQDAAQLLLERTVNAAKSAEGSF